ncbi:hypothetical protein GCM10022199_16610 [Marihabitans asiaticum]|uniref:Uncharacterized protein n=1 Tax=Marihabitans asiaticum TaxID=415218 RepID=A0A560W7Q5_9MICO|nr:hypothetical protein FB557_2284 [Marihabitans asiaticum]
MHDFTVDEAFRANDFAVRLLGHFGDTEGLEEAKRIRHEALATQEGMTEQVVVAETASKFPSSLRGAAIRGLREEDRDCRT